MYGGSPVHLMWSNSFNPDRPKVERPVDWRRIAEFFLPYWRQEVLVLACILLGAVLGLGAAAFHEVADRRRAGP